MQKKLFGRTTCEKKLGQREQGAKIQIKRVPFGVFSTSHFAPPALSLDKDQPGTMKNHKNQPGIIKKQLGTIKNHENPPRTMKNHKELDLRPLGKVIIFRDRQTDKQTEPSYYI